MITQAQIRDKIYKVVNDKCTEEVDVGISECESLNVAMQMMLEELDSKTMDVFTRRILDNVGGLLRIQERTFEMLEKQNDNVENELMQIVRSIADNKTTA